MRAPPAAPATFSTPEEEPNLPPRPCHLELEGAALLGCCRIEPAKGEARQERRRRRPRVRTGPSRGRHGSRGGVP